VEVFVVGVVDNVLMIDLVIVSLVVDVVDVVD